MREKAVGQSLLIRSIKKDRDHRDQDFLPLALAILERPASPIGVGLMYSICTFTLAALVWSWVCRIDIYATAAGKLESAGRSKVVQTAVAGRVDAIYVENGQHVLRGETLIRLDPAEANAVRKEALGDSINERAEIERRKTATSVDTRNYTDMQAEVAWSTEIPLDIRAREDRVLHADLAQLAATLDSLHAKRRQKEVDENQLVLAKTAQEAIISVLSERTAMRVTLAQKSVGSRANVLDALREQREAEANLLNVERAAANAASDIDVIESDIKKTKIEFIKENCERIEAAERRAEELVQTLTKAELNVSQTNLRSPATGVVQALSITTIGQFINSGEGVMTIVPDDVPLEITAYVPNSDIGFITRNQAAAIKIDSFPFMRYGMLNGVVTRVANDAIPSAEAVQDQRDPSSPMSRGLSATLAAEATRDLVFPITVSLVNRDITIDGRKVQLMPGMTATVEIKTGRRRVIDYILSPFVDIGSSALRER